MSHTHQLTQSLLGYSRHLPRGSKLLGQPSRPNVPVVPDIRHHLPRISDLGRDSRAMGLCSSQPSRPNDYQYRYERQQHSQQRDQREVLRLLHPAHRRHPQDLARHPNRAHGKFPPISTPVSPFHTNFHPQSLWSGFYQSGTTYKQSNGFLDEILRVNDYYKDAGFVHYFNTTGILAHNDIGPQYHPTDFGALKVAAHMQQYIKLTFGWEFLTTGPEIQSGTLYWNDQSSY